MSTRMVRSIFHIAKSGLLIWSLALFSLVSIVTLKSTDKVELRVFTEPVKISFKRSTPPIAALEDLVLVTHEPIRELRWKMEGPATQLRAGESFDIKSLLKESSASRLNAFMNGDNESTKITIVESGKKFELRTFAKMSIHRVSTSGHKVLIAKNTNVSEVQKTNRRKTKASTTPLQIQDLNVSHYMKARLEKVGGMKVVRDTLELEKPSQVNADFEESPSFEDLVKKLVSSEVEEEKKRQVASLTGNFSGVKVEPGKVLVLPATPAASTSSTSSSKVSTLGSNTDQSLSKTVATASSLPENSAKLTTDSSGAKGVKNISGRDLKKYESSILRNVTLRGHIEMAGGAAFLGSESQLKVYRVEEGIRREEGHVWIRDANFELAVQETRGKVVVEMRDLFGRLTGLGDFELQDIKKSQVESNRVSGLKLFVSPVRAGAFGKVISGYSYGATEIPVANPQILLSSSDQNQVANKKGEFGDSDITNDSFVKVRAGVGEHWSTLKFIAAGSSQKIKLYSQKMVQALSDLIKENEAASRAVRSFLGEKAKRKAQSLIWGEVRGHNGKPLKGARVQLANSDLKPIYFNEWLLPDHKLKETSKNGLYVFQGVEPGDYLIGGYKGTSNLAPQIITVEEFHITSVDLIIDKLRKVQVTAYNALDIEERLSATVRVVGRNRTYGISESGVGVLPLSSRPGFDLIEAESTEDFETIRISQPHKKNFIHLPMIETEWLDYILSSSNAEVDKNLSTVVGFVESNGFFESYEANLGVDVSADNFQIIYFNDAGEVVDTGESGGGFVIYNAPIGLQTLVISPEGAPIHSQIIATTPERVNVAEIYY